MEQQSWLTERFEENRARLRAVAYRMLGSLSEAEDAVQEAWLRLHRTDSDAGAVRQREVVEAFLRAVRAGDIEGLLAVLDPDAVIHIDAASRIDAPAAEVGQPREVRGASTWARQFIALSRGPRGQRFVQAALIDGSVGLIFAPRGQLSRALAFTFANAKVMRVEVIGDPARLRELDIAVPWDPEIT